MRHIFLFGADDGNRTHATSLEGWDSTIELHPHFDSGNFHRPYILAYPALFVNIFDENFPLLFFEKILLSTVIFVEFMIK